MSRAARITLVVLLLSIPFSGFPNGSEPSPGRTVPETPKGSIGGQKKQREAKKPTTAEQQVTSKACQEKRRNDPNVKYSEPGPCDPLYWFRSAQDVIAPFVLLAAGLAAYWARRAANAGIAGVAEAKRAATATEIAANAAKKSADLQETAVFLNERAYIVAKVPDAIALSNGVRVSINVRNAGKTYGTVERLVCGLRQYSTDTFPQTPVYSGLHEIFPQLPIDNLPVCIGSTEISDPELTKGHPLFLIGYIEYTDIFDKTHFTRFCWLVKSRETVSNDWDFIRAGSKAYNNTNDDPPERTY